MVVDNQMDGRAILSALPVPILLIANNDIIVANSASEDFFSQSKKRLEGKKLSDIVKFNDERINEAIQLKNNNLSAQNMEILLPKGMVQVDIWISEIDMPPASKILMIMKRHIKRDYIGDHSEAGDQFALGAPAILSHEIKNPLAGIKGAAQFLSKTGDESTHSMTQLIVTEVDRIARLLDQMQNLGNQTPAKFNEENIHIILDQAVQSIKVANPDFPDIICRFDPSLPDIYVDYDAVLQILINLIQNAIDACKNIEEPKIIISTRFVLSGALRRANDDESHQTIKLPIEVMIKDNGPGIPKHIENELFTPFVTTKREGQGLGLAIVRKFIRQLNSRILHERDDKNGMTIFRILLPMASYDAALKTIEK